MKWAAAAIFAILIAAAITYAQVDTYNIQRPTITNGVVSCNWLTAPYCRIAVTQNILTLNLNFPADATPYTLEFDQDTVGHTVALPTNILQSNGSPLNTITPNPNTTTILSLISNTQSGNYYLVGGSGNGIGVSFPLITSLGGSGLSGNPPNGILVSQGTNPFLPLLLGPNQFIEGGPMGSAAPPIVTDSPTIGGHFKIDSSLTSANLTGCGTGPAISGADGWFDLTIGSSPVPGCTVKFNTPFVGAVSCSVTPSVDPTVYSTLNPVMPIVDPGGTFVQIAPQTLGADIGCIKVTVHCVEIVS